MDGVGNAVPLEIPKVRGQSGGFLICRLPGIGEMGEVSLLEVLGGANVDLAVLLSLYLCRVDHVCLETLSIQWTGTGTTSAVTSWGSCRRSRTENLRIVAGDEGIHAGETSIGYLDRVSIEQLVKVA